MLVANRLMDPSSETTYAMLGIGAGEYPGPSPIVACASTRTIISRQFSMDAIPTEDGKFPRCKKKKEGRNVCVCVCVKIFGLRWRGHYILNDEKKCSGADCYNVCYGCFFSKGSPSDCILVTKSKVK